MRKYYSYFFIILSAICFSQQNKVIDDLNNQLGNNNRQDTIRASVILKLSMAYYGLNPDKMLQYANESLALSDKLNFKKGIGESYKLIGAAYYAKGNFTESEDYFTKALIVFQEIKFFKGMILCYSNLGGIKTVQNKYPEALKLYQNSIRICEKTNETKLSGFAKGNMGIIYNELKNYDLALKYFTDALETHKKANYQEGIAANLANIGNTYFAKKQYDQALNYFINGLKKNIEINNKTGIAREYGNIASVLIEQKKFDEAFENHSKALAINEEIKNKKGIAVNYQRIGEYYLKQNKFDESLNYLIKANNFAKQIGIKDIQKESNSSLSELFEKLGKTDSSYIYFKKYIVNRDEIENENNRKQISRLEIQYEFDNKEEKYKIKQLLDQKDLKQQQLLLALNNSKLSESNKQRDLVRLNFLKTQTELKSEQLVRNAQKKQLTIAEKEIELKQKVIKINIISLEAKEKEKLYLFGGIGLLLIIGGLLFYQNRKRKQLNQKLETLNYSLEQANKVKARFFGILNHDLRSPVNNLIHYLHLQKESPELLDDDSKNQIEFETLTSAENLLGSMEDILLWSKGQMENFKPNFENVLVSKIFSDTQKHFSSEKQVSIVFENTQNIALFTDENYLKTIIRNLTGNAVKALNCFVTRNAENPTIRWKSWQEIARSGGYVQNFLSIQDNGPGANAEQFRALYDDNEVIGIQSGLGLHLIRDLAKAIDCEIKVESKINEGITFVLKFK